MNNCYLVLRLYWPAFVQLLNIYLPQTIFREQGRHIPVFHDDDFENCKIIDHSTSKKNGDKHDSRQENENGTKCLSRRSPAQADQAPLNNPLNITTSIMFKQPI
jgi:hypothetical protein